MDSIKLSICIVTYESVDMVKTFHSSLIQSLSKLIDWEVLYFDNSKTTDVSDYIRSCSDNNVLFQRDDRNLGFSYGNNRLIINAKYENILLLNPDVFGLTSEFFVNLSSYYNRQDVLFIKLLNEDGSFQNCIGAYSSLKRAFGHKVDYSKVSNYSDIDMGIMAFMLTSKKVISHVGLLDCDYPLYAEDMDWCYRAKKMGYSILYEPNLSLTHIGGASSKSKWKTKEVNKKKLNAEAIFIKKHYHGVYKYIMLALNTLKRMLNSLGLGGDK